MFYFPDFPGKKCLKGLPTNLYIDFKMFAKMVRKHLQQQSNLALLWIIYHKAVLIHATLTFLHSLNITII